MGLSWTAPLFTGGDVIEDYRVNYREEGGTYSVLEANIVTATYTAINLTPGLTYEFTVEARNSYGYSVVSESISLLCAFKPFPPLTVTSANVNDKV